MIRSRYNPQAGQAQERALRELTGHASPAAWVEEAAALLGGGCAFVLLVGGADLPGFRVRVAQSQARADGLPGCFDHAALLLPEGEDDLTVFHVPLRAQEVHTVTQRNGIQQTDLTFLHDGFARYPNLALLRFPVDDAEELRKTALALRGARLSEDLVTPLSRWLAYVWSALDNPLNEALGVPSAMFVEACYAAARQDITPGMQERVVTPEAIWQAARWWPEYYQDDTAREPLGYFTLGQRAACASWPSAQGSV